MFAESTDTFGCFFLAMSFYDNLFQLLRHSVWSFVGDFPLRSFYWRWEFYEILLFLWRLEERKCGVYSHLFVFTVFRYLNDIVTVISISVTFSYFPLHILWSLSFHFPFFVWYLFFCFLWHSCLFLSFTISSALFFCCSTFGCFSVQVCLYKCVCMCVCARSSTC